MGSSDSALSTILPMVFFNWTSCTYVDVSQGLMEFNGISSRYTSGGTPRTPRNVYS